MTLQHLLLGGRWLLAIVLGGAAAAKLVGRRDILASVTRYEILPALLVRPVAGLLVPAECALALCLAAGLAPRISAALVALMLTAFAGAIAINLARGRTFACGCGASDSSIRWSLVARNLALAVVAIAIAVGPTTSLALLNVGDRAASPNSDAGVIAVPMSVILMCLIATTVSRQRKYMASGMREISGRLQVTQTTPRG
jgi:hypothetical protein